MRVVVARLVATRAGWVGGAPLAERAPSRPPPGAAPTSRLRSRAVARLPLAAALGLALAAACAPDPITVPSLAGAQTAVLVIESPAGLRAFAHDLVATPEALAVPVPDEAARLTLMLHTRSLAELDLDPGELRLVTSGERVRPLPTAEALYLAEAPELARWSAAMTLRAPVAALRVSRSSREACFARARCLDDTGLCVPCGPDPVIAPPDFEDAPTLPVLTPCPSGWVERAVVTSTAGATRAYAACDARAWACAEGLARLDTGACEPVGEACPAPPARWADAPMGARYVDAAALAPGDGSMATPWRTLDEAVRAAGPAPTLALAPGAYTLSLDLPAGTRLIGACTRGTVVRGRVRSPDGSSLYGLRVEGAVYGGGLLELEAIELQGSLRGEEASLTVRSSVLTASVVAVGGALTLHHARVNGPLDLSGVATATISDSVLTSGLNADHGTISATRVLLGPTTLEQSVLELAAANLTGPLVLRGGHASLSKVWSHSWLDVNTYADVRVTDLLMSEDLTHDRIVLDTAMLSLANVAITNVEGQGIVISETLPSSTLTLADVTISARDVARGSDNSGIQSRGGYITGARLLIEGAEGPGLAMTGDEASVVLTDVRVRSCGDGISVRAARNLDLTRAAVHQTRGRGIEVGHMSGYPNVHLVDVDIDGVRPPRCMKECLIAGLSFLGRELVATRLRLANSQDVGLALGVIDENANVRLELDQVVIEGNAVGIDYTISEDRLDALLPALRLIGNAQSLRDH